MNRKIRWRKWKIAPKAEADDIEKQFMTLTPIDTLLEKFYGNGRNLKLWGGNSNFNISQTVSSIMRKVPGVEIVSVFSRYKFRIGVGELFSSRQVLEDIKISLGCVDNYLMDESLILEIRSLRLKLEKFRIPWLIYVLPNGKYEYLQEVDKDKFKEQQDNYLSIKNAIGGYLLHSQSGV